MSAPMNVSFQLKKSKVDELGRVPIYVRITINGVRTEFSIKRTVELSKWISAAGIVKGHSEESKSLNAFLAAVRLRLNEIYRELLESKEAISIDKVKNLYLGVNVRAKTRAVRYLCRQLFTDEGIHDKAQYHF